MYIYIYKYKDRWSIKTLLCKHCKQHSKASSYYIEQALVHLTLAKEQGGTSKLEVPEESLAYFLLFWRFCLCLVSQIHTAMHVAVWQARSRASPSSGSSNCHGIASEMEACSFEAAVHAMRILSLKLWPEKFLHLDSLGKFAENVIPFWRL